MSGRAAPSPRLRQPWSPARPSPLGLPPMGFAALAPHIAFQSPPYPVTPQRPIQPKGPSESKVSFPPEARRPLAGTQRPRSHAVPPPLTLNTEDHPPTQPQYPATAQPGSMPEMLVSPPSPTPSDTSSLSLYSADSVSKKFPIDVVGQKQQEEEEKSPALFCGCINFKAWFSSRSKAKQNKILGPPAPAVPAPAPPMVQVRRRPPPLNM